MANKRNEIEHIEKLLKNKKKKYVRLQEGAELYSLGLHMFREIADEAHAVVKLRKVVLVDTEILDQYLDTFRN